jgi:signal transduction histidine kinase
MTEKSTPNTQQQSSANTPTKEVLNKLLLQQQKLASLGMLSAGIAHEIQNPLNFVINFSKMSEKLIDDLKEVVNDVREHIPEDDANELDDITTDLNVNLQKIREHGERAVSIIQGILLISLSIPCPLKTLSSIICLAYHFSKKGEKLHVHMWPSQVAQW